jgi:hypothetical protein
MRPESASKGLLVMAIAGIMAGAQARYALAAPAKSATPVAVVAVPAVVPAAPAPAVIPAAPTLTSAASTDTTTTSSHVSHSRESKIVDPFAVTEISLLSFGSIDVSPSQTVVVSPPPSGRTVVQSPPPKGGVVIPPPPPLP